MDRVDVHDQLRLQRYLLQMQTCYKKYYKSIFLGLVHVAIVKAYIVFREAQKSSTGKPITHAEFLLEVHAEMLALGEETSQTEEVIHVVSTTCWIGGDACPEQEREIMEVDEIGSTHSSENSSQPPRGIQRRRQFRMEEEVSTDHCRRQVVVQEEVMCLEGDADSENRYHNALLAIQNRVIEQERRIEGRINELREVQRRWLEPSLEISQRTETSAKSDLERATKSIEERLQQKLIEAQEIRLSEMEGKTHDALASMSEQIEETMAPPLRVTRRDAEEFLRRLEGRVGDERERLVREHAECQTETIPCLSAMRAYHRWMGGVDVHDQLRLQRYSLQMSLRFRKYYKSLALGLIDMAIVNSFIIYREARKMRGDPPANHAGFITQLQAQLLAVGPAEFADALYSPGPIAPTRGDNSSTSGRHKLEMDNEWTEVNDIRKRRQRQCKVCTIRKTTRAKRQMTRFYCPKCSRGSKRVYLCDKVRQGHYQVNNLTCYEIWHQLCRNGTERPQPRCGRGIQTRAPGKKHSNAEDEVGDDAEDASSGINHSGEDREANSDTVVEKCTDGSNNEEEDTGYEEGGDKEMPARADEVSDGSEGGSGEEAGDDAAL
ncbi:hypothetical protein PHPALM_27847 [Phytophthora palmivora]|uniref:PiggyBac transposable element-derived protein domain-containing protein n=1 Tax=Phytophthora palmivora TaxID=4796 RepID=A0A2P4XBL7_9STRA|nr:hypothetical protein PHPALM_27847 [Phytophthora palmivora]